MVEYHVDAVLVLAVYDRPARIVGVEVISIVCIVQMSTVTHGGRYDWTGRGVQRSLMMLSATSIHGSQHRACGNYSRAYESSLMCEIAFADKAPLSARKGMGIQASASSDSVASLGSGRDSK
jgi:hypothetical protein